MISASHNPCEYNGIKIFQRTGYKLPDAMEEEIEAIILDEVRMPPVVIGGDVGKVTLAQNAVRDYINHIAETADRLFYGMRIALDCANGSASVTANTLFKQLGAECVVINANPDGTNINEKCGSTHIDALGEYVKTHGYELGFAFDGDADRLLAVDKNGNLCPGADNRLTFRAEGSAIVYATDAGDQREAETFPRPDKKALSGMLVCCLLSNGNKGKATVVCSADGLLAGSVSFECI